MPLKLGHYFVVTNPETPLNEVSGFLLDANFVGQFYDWFLATKPDEVTTQKLVPILNLIREKRLIHWQFGALERAWAWQEIKEVNSSNFSRINPSLFQRIGLAFETILYATDTDYKNWTSISRDFSIPFARSAKSQPVAKKLTREEASDFFQVVAPGWIAVLLLMHFENRIHPEASIEELTELFLEWRRAVRATGAPDSSEVLLIGELFFFGGTISGNYYEENYLGEPKNFREFDRKNLLKIDSWLPVGKVKIARNIAFDLALLNIQHFYRFGIKQREHSLVRVPRETIAIVTGDHGLAVISQQFGPAFEVPGKLPARIHYHPENSRFRRERPIEDLQLLSNFSFRPPQDLPRQDQLGKPLKDLIEMSLGRTF